MATVDHQRSWKQMRSAKMYSRDHVFLIGPGGVGKSTVGAELGKIIGCVFYDLDDLFTKQIGGIQTYIAGSGYASCVQANAALCRQFIEQNSRKSFILALSSGFLSTDILPDVVRNNREMIKRSGLSVLLMPSQDYAVAERIVIKRQLARGFDLAEDKEKKKFASRFPDYLSLGDINIFSVDPPQKIACLIAVSLRRWVSGSHLS